MNFNLSIDCGNTLTSFALFQDEGELHGCFTISTQINRSSDEYYSIFQNFFNTQLVQRCTVSCVVHDAMYGLRMFCIRYLQCPYVFLDYVVYQKIGLSFPGKVDRYKYFGSDRVANAFGIHSGQKVIIVDFGSALTIDIAMPSEAIYGGCIFPGVQSAMYGLSQYIPALPRCSIVACNKISAETIQGIQYGFFNGYRYLIKGIVEELSEKYKTQNVYITGGFSWIVDECDSTWIFDQFLTIKGINNIGGMYFEQ